ncbi:ferritin-like fold-containing protein [Agromyces marinus]|uniref:ferritin-like fold-containing protein n=1 Tax=Agromyces marinus TaxID=1389020 RepID=UPI0025741EA7|nr:ferritin-like fold-containing protein [Agromyces marinus]
MVNWPTSRRPRPEAPRLRPRVAPTELSRIDFTEFTPEPVAFLGQAAYVQLEIFENLARAVSTAPELGAKEGLSATAGVALRRHHELIAELRRLGAEPAKVMAPFAPALDRFRQATSGADWYELLLGIHITSGMLDDYFVRLAEGSRTSCAGASGRSSADRARRRSSNRSSSAPSRPITRSTTGWRSGVGASWATRS